MKKLTVFFIASMAFLQAVYSQAYESAIQFDKKKQPAIAIDYPYPAEAVENAVIQRMLRLGYKAKEEKGFLNKDKGFIVFKNAYITEISVERLDYIVKVERKSRKASDESELYLVMMKSDDNAIGRMSAFDIGRAKTFLNEMLPDIEAANLELQIKNQEEAIAKAEKKLKGLQDDRVELDKKFSENLRSQDETIKDIDTQRQILERLKEKRSKN